MTKNTINYGFITPLLYYIMLRTCADPELFQVNCSILDPFALCSFAAAS